MARTVDELLQEARAKLDRVSPQQASEAAAADTALIVDIRAESQRAEDGIVPGAVFIPRNVLEWRADPASMWRDERLTQGQRLIVMCNEGYQSSLAAAVLQELGLEDATDLVGGFQAWRRAGLPVEPSAEA
jgi:rhodanese-related sulfurtransferase